MPYDSERDQFYWDPFRQAHPNLGSFAKDGSNYDPSVPKPKLSDARRVLANKFRPRQTFQVTIVGKLYFGSSKIDGLSFVTDMNTIEYASLQGGHGGGGTATLESKLEELSGYTGFERVTGIYFRPLN